MEAAPRIELGYTAWQSLVFDVFPLVSGCEVGELGRRGTRWERVSGFAGS